ncbi:hypothetical protein IQ259_08505 [Fortiea sp. LEGE XX443]|uniref:hypothetical protein n=1 Tax=Fortiea sp. LEGE XX443 TaxID=1828611 RepID=UPI001882BB4C|nr:hypothetical protein [Fortiea sp. LEGE XX443]MBE9005078.1 hypothetical protein [Fortiea sp. LEGE XX443]
MTNKEELSQKDFYEYTVRQIEREQNLVNNRLSWMLTFQGFLFASIALVANKDTEPSIRLVFRNVIPAIGIAVALLAFIGIHAAALSSNEIKAKWKQRAGFQDYPPTFGTSKISLLGRITSYGIPTSVVLAWLLLLFGLITVT